MSRDNAPSGLITATRIVLSEIAEILGPYPRAVIAGGTVPYLLIPQDHDPHEGTVDIDVVFDLDQPGASDVLTLHAQLEQRLFQQEPRKPYRYNKFVGVGGQSYSVLIEFLGGGDPPSSGLEYIPTEDIHVSIIKGMEIALVRPIEVTLPEDPNQGISVASLPAFLAMKAVALDRRSDLKKTKDAYDIIYCLRNFPGGVNAVVEQFQPYRANPIVASAMTLLTELFASVEAIGPVAYARATDRPEDADMMKQEAFARVQQLLAKLANGVSEPVDDLR